MKSNFFQQHKIKNHIHIVLYQKSVTNATNQTFTSNEINVDD